MYFACSIAVHDLQHVCVWFCFMYPRNRLLANSSVHFSGMIGDCLGFKVEFEKKHKMISLMYSLHGVRMDIC